MDFNGNPIGTGTFSPAGYRKVGDQYAPVDPSGNQVSPLIPISGVPSNFADRGNGILTPTSGNGDYYTVDPATTYEAARMIVEENLADHIDMNFGCPVPKVTRRGGGAALPYKRRLFSQIVAAAVRATEGTTVPVTVSWPNDRSR